MLSLWGRLADSSMLRPWKTARALRMAVPWLTTATVSPGWLRAICRMAAEMRSRSSAKLSPPSTFQRRSVPLNQASCWASVRATSPQVRSSHTPMATSRRLFRVVRANPFGP